MRGGQEKLDKSLRPRGSPPAEEGPVLGSCTPSLSGWGWAKGPGSDRPTTRPLARLPPSPPVPEAGSPTQAPGAGPLQRRGLIPRTPAATSTAGPLDVNSDLPEVVARHRGVRTLRAASHHFVARSSGPRRASD